VTTFDTAFRFNQLTSIPAGLFDSCPNVTNFGDIFILNQLTSIPAGLFDNCPNVTDFSGAFRLNQLTSIPAGLFNNCPNVTDFALIFDSNTLEVNSLSRLYIELSIFNTQDNVPFDGGSGQYDPTFTAVIDSITYTTGVERSNLITRGWTLTDGGLSEEFYFNIEVDTSIAGVSNSDQFQFTGAVGEYDVEAYQNDSLVASFSDLVNEQTITLPSSGVYELRVIPKAAGFDKLRFNNGGDKDKLLKVLQWGLYGVNQPNQESAFFGCNLTQIPDGGAWFDVVTDGFQMFLFNSLTSLPAGMELPNLSDGDFMFRDNSLTSLPAGMELPNLSDGADMFRDNSLTSLPAGMELPNLSNGFQMFLFNSLTSLPAGMELPNLSDGNGMFSGNTINTARYSQLLIDLEANNPNNDVAFHGGNSQYNAAGQTARNALIARGWTITDSGLEI
jgi:hypothetical protein